MQGTALLHSGGADAHRRAVFALRQATALDSGFVQAWAALAVAESRQYRDGTNLSLPDPALAAAAKVHAERAIGLAPHLAGAHLALASYYGNVMSDHRRAVAEDSVAHQLTPNDVDVLTSMAAAERDLDNHDAAVSLYQRAEALDPRSLSAASGLAASLRLAGRYAEAIAAAERGLQVDPTRTGLLVELRGYGSRWETRSARTRR